MAMKKTFVIVLSLIFLIPLLSASSFDTAMDASKKVLESSLGLLTPFFEFIIGDSGSSEFFFAKVLLLILLVLIINVILKRIEMFNTTKGVSITIALIVSILGVRFISENELTLGILLPYGTLGVALTSALPFIIFFYFIHITNMGGLGRRLMWAFFAITFIALWVNRYSTLSPVSNQIYGWTLFAIILAFIFDRGIHRYFMTHELNKFVRGANQRTIVMLQSEYLNILSVDTREARTRRAEIEAQLRRLGASLP